MQFIWLTREPDLIIELQESEELYGFLVSKSCLRVSSHVFERMLRPLNGFRPLPETTLNGLPVSVLRLHDDDFTALGWILNIIHFQPSGVPRVLDWESFYAIAVLCDKYNLQRPVEIWVEKWAEMLLPDSAAFLSDMLSEGCEEWLFIAQAFPSLQKCVQLANRVYYAFVEELIGDMELSEEVMRLPRVTDLATQGQPVLVDFEMVPESVFVNIRKTRQEGFDKGMSELKRHLLEIQVTRTDIGQGGDTNFYKTCASPSGCYDKSLASSIGAAINSDWDMEVQYCELCLRRNICLWQLQERVEVLQKQLKYYEDIRETQKAAFERSQMRMRRKQKRSGPNQGGNVTTRLGGMWVHGMLE